MRSEDIPQILDRLEAVFDPKLEDQRKEAFKTKDYKNIPKKPLMYIAGYQHDIGRRRREAIRIDDRRWPT